MKKLALSILSLTVSLTLLCSLACPAWATAGAADDPVVSESYLEQIFGPDLARQISELQATALDDFSADTFQTLCQVVAQANAKRQQMLLGYQTYSGTAQFKQSDVLTLRAGTKLTLHAGSAQVDTWGLVDVTVGAALSVGDLLPQDHTCMAGQDCTLHILSATVSFTARGVLSLAGSTARDYNSCAAGLNALGLMQGTGTGDELERPATRAEALVLFLRLIGEDKAALSWTGTHPFTDVPDWASRYVAYAYAKGYTKGINAAEFGSSQSVTAQDYLTFLLRALGYQEGINFAWSTALADGRSLGVITAQEQTLLEQETFLRAHVAWLSWYALFAQHQDYQETMLEVLLEKGAVSYDDLAGAVVQIVGIRS